MVTIYDTEYDTVTTTSISLTYKFIESTDLNELFDKLNKCVNLKWLNLSHNCISDLPPNIFDKLNKLTVLRLSHNEISTLPPNIFDQLTNLSFLG